MNAIYPVGSIYWSAYPTDPSILFGGTWERLRDCFLWATGDNTAIPETNGCNPNARSFEYGETQHLLTLNEIPSHNHDWYDPGHGHDVYASNTNKVGAMLGGTGESAIVGFTTYGSSTAFASGATTNITFNAQGGGQSHNNMPPYIRRYCWQRTA